MKTTFLSLLLFASLALTLPSCIGCGGFGANTEDNSEASTDDDNNDNSGSDGGAQNLNEAANQVQEAMKQLNNGEKVEVINFRDLKEFLPDKLAGVSKTDDGGETAGAMGMTISTAEGTYEEGDQKFELKIVDTGGLGMAMMGMAAWASMTVDRESDDGYERTGTIDGYKSYEKYTKASKRGEVSVIIGNRFVVQLTGRNISMDDLKDAVDSLDLKGIEKLG